MSDPARINRPGARTNPPEHLFDNGTGIAEGRPEAPDLRDWHHEQTGPGTAPPDLDVSDPHPYDEGDPYAAPHPGGVAEPSSGANPERRSGHAPAAPAKPNES